ncbi:hypothetical protein TWF718_000724 [Orbilia javanica]|uniref:Uncharacterized protein n=1 Tax=Orbilia javanica TaxID=47235 RepID=A0AAN8MXI7_9PEZI
MMLATAATKAEWRWRWQRRWEEWRMRMRRSGGVEEGNRKMLVGKNGSVIVSPATSAAGQG